MRTCTVCNETKPLTEFNKAKHDKLGLHSSCKPCHRAQARESAKNNMWVNGRYIPMKHPLHKPGRYKTLDDAWSHVEIDERSTEGQVYIIANKAFPNWYKVGKAVNAEDRLSGYQTSSPHRDYELLYKIDVDNRHTAETSAHNVLRDLLPEEHCQNEWFNWTLEDIKLVLDNVEAAQKQLDLLDQAV